MFHISDDDRRSLDSLASPAFILAITLLLLNDLIFKWSFPGVVTGKLSDFAGLYAFAFFFSTLIPSRRFAIHVATAAAFTCWKLPPSSSLIAAWNSLDLFPVDRVTDLSDLAALIMLLPSYLSSARRRNGRSHPVTTILLCGLALFAFAATSYRTHKEYDQRFVFDGSTDVLKAQLEASGIRVFTNGERYSAAAPPGGWVLTALGICALTASTRSSPWIQLQKGSRFT